MRVAVLKAPFDEDARVWYVESSDIEGLHVEGATFEAFRRNVAAAAAARLRPRWCRCMKDFGKPVHSGLPREESSWATGSAAEFRPHGRASRRA